MMKVGGQIGEVRWRALDREGRDSCRLVAQEGGYMLLGHARFREAEGASAIDYLVRCDRDWRTLGCDVTGLWRDRTVAVHIARDEGVWRMNGFPQPDLDAACDIDLGFTPSTNLMPLRRMPEIGSLDVTAAWLVDPSAALAPLAQRYTRARGGFVHYRASDTGFETDLRVAESGFVTLYPGFWQAEHIG